jgi:phosphoribosylformimino-5-aminoimidazole carboxamide ribotide isomerase
VEVIPALDLRGGQVVRLHQGDFAQEKAYGSDAVERARQYAAQGAERLHLVDLDAAAGAGSNRDLVSEVVDAAGVEVQVAGGVRSLADVEAWLAAGAAGVVMGTTAVREPAILRDCAARHPGRVLAALDVKAGRAAVTGWTAVEERSLEALLGEWEEAALAGVILTCVDRDGTLAGPDLVTLRRVVGATRHAVIYSGGIASLADLRALLEAGAAAAILGKSLLEARFTLQEAIAECASLR